MNYLNYYNLEDYLFTEVTTSFRDRGYLTPEEFFSIVIWKANRAKSRIKRKLLAQGNDLASAVKNLTQELNNAASDRHRLSILLNTWHLALPMATAILTVLYPDRFTVYDIRARQQLGFNDFAGRKDQIDRYFDEFLPKVVAISQAKTLRDKDRYLWGKSAYEDLQAFLRKP
jgi:hypothetical protein